MLQAAKSGHSIVFAAIWLAFCAVILAWRLSSGAPIQTDIRAILPEERHAPAVEEALAKANAAAANRIALLVEAPDRMVAQNAVDELEAALVSNGLFFSDLEDGETIGRWIYANRRELSCERSPDNFDQKTAKRIEQKALARIYGVASPVTSDLLKADPFLLTLYLSDCLSSGAAKGAGENQRLLSGRLTRPAYELGTQAEIESVLATWRSDWEPQGATLTRSGAVFHASHAASQAQGEISLIGGAGLLGVVGLFWLVFGRVSNIIATALMIGAACLSGFAITMLVFEQVHMLALVFAAMLVGIVADYAVHSMAASTACGWESIEARFKHLIRPMTISMLTTATGFGGLAFLGVDLFRQLAVFAVTGVATAWALVLLVYLQLDRKPKDADRLQARWRKLNGVLDVWQPPAMVGLGFGLLMILMGVAGAATGGAIDDVRQFQARNDVLMAEEEKIATLLGGSLDQVFLISKGDTPEAARRTEEAAIAVAPKDAHFLALSTFDPSADRRAANETALMEELETPFLEAHIQRLGLTSPEASSSEPVARPEFFNDLEFVGRDGDHYLIARASGVIGWDGPAVEGAVLVDAADQYSRAFGRYRVLALKSLFVAAVVAGVFVVVVYRQLAALLIVAAPFAAMMTGIWMPVMFGEKTSFFSMAAGMVLFGVGVDYSAFAWEAAQKRESWTRTSVLVGALTTLLSMGLMTLSSSLPVRSFGLTVSTGVIAALCLCVAPFLVSKGGEIHANRNL